MGLPGTLRDWNNLLEILYGGFRYFLLSACTSIYPPYNFVLEIISNRHNKIVTFCHILPFFASEPTLSPSWFYLQHHHQFGQTLWVGVVFWFFLCASLGCPVVIWGTLKVSWRGGCKVCLFLSILFFGGRKFSGGGLEIYGETKRLYCVAMVDL